jgi:predicted anti-sigma-YlaC factor YlaD
MKVTLDCKEVSRLISDGQDQELPPAERARMRLHFVMCQTCRDVDEQMNFLRRAMRQLGREDPDTAERPDPPKP